MDIIIAYKKYMRYGQAAPPMPEKLEEAYAYL
jgi:hypothetical protein